MDHTVLPATNTMSALPRKRSPDGATTDWGCGHLIASYCSFIDPERMKGWVGWLADLQRTVYPHSCHPSTAGRAQDRVSSPTKDRRSANCATQPTRVCAVEVLRSKNSCSGAQQKAEQQQIKRVQGAVKKHGRSAVTSAGWCSVEP